MKTRWLLWILVIAFVWVVISRFTEFEKLAETLSRGRWQWVGVAGLLQVLFYIMYSGLYWSALDIVGVKSSVWGLLPVTFASLFVNVATPLGGTGGMSLFVDDARRRGQSAARAAVGTLLALAADFGGFVVILAIGIVFLFLQHDLKPYEIGSAVILLCVIGGLTSLLMLGVWKPELLRGVLRVFQRVVNYPASRFKRPNFLAEDWAEKNSVDFIEASLAVAAYPDRLARTLLISLACYVVDIASLYFVFLAFAQPVGFGLLVAGFSMGILFWIVSITPQGIGVVEGMMTLVFTSLGVPAGQAAVVAIAFRGLTFWLPLFIGFILLRRIPTFAGETYHGNDLASIRLVAILTAGMGVINILSAITPSVKDRLVLLEKYSPFGVTTGGHLTVALGGLALLLLAAGLWRRKRTSWLLTLAILIISIPAHLIKGLDYEEAILASLLAGWLFTLRAHFHTRSDAPSVRQGLLAVLIAFAFTFLYGIAGFYLLDHHFKVNFGFWAAARQTVVMFTEYYSPGLEPITGFGRYFADSIYIVSAATGLYALLMLIRPVLMRQQGSLEEREKARLIVESYGHSSLARLTLLDDKSYFFSPGGSVISCIVQGRIALTLGDPIGPLEDAGDIVSAFKEFCSANDWQPVFYQVLGERLEIYKALGFDSLCIGHEGIVNLATFTLAGGENKNIRTAVNRMNKLGYRAEVVMPPHPAHLLSELREVSEEWLTEMHGTEKRFSLGWFDEAYLNDCHLILIWNPQGQVDAFANILQEYQANEISIDLMRHRRSAERGQMDYLFASLIEWARGKGFASFNFGLSALSGIGEKMDDPAIERALHYIYEHVNQFYNFKGLHEFKEKYHPSWSPRYLIFPGVANLPAATVAILRADSGGNLFG